MGNPVWVLAGVWRLRGQGAPVLEWTRRAYSAIKNNEFIKFSDKWMTLEDIVFSEVNKSQKEFT